MATIGETTQKINELNKRYNMYERAYQAEKQRLNAEIVQKFTTYKQACEEILVSDREKTERTFMQELDRSLAQIHTDYNIRVETLNDDYRNFRDTITQSNLELQSLAENALNAQQALSADYYAILECARNSAMKFYKRAYCEVMEFAENRMMKWFPPDNSSLYLEHLRTAHCCIERQLYQAALGIADSVMLSINIDKTRIDHLFVKWLHNCLALKAAMGTEREVVYHQCVCTDDWMDDELMDLLEINNYMLSEDDIKEWIDPDYWNKLKQFEEINQQMNDILESADLNNDICGDAMNIAMRKMESTTVTDPISAESIYSIVKESYCRIDAQMEYIRTMRTRIQCYGERYKLTDMLQEMMDDYGYLGEGCEDRKNTVSLHYETCNDSTVDVFIIPIEYADKTWRNCVGYIVNGNQRLENELRNLLNDNNILNETYYYDNGSASAQKLIRFTRSFESKYRIKRFSIN